MRHGGVVRHVAFFRNLNLGQGLAPTRPRLVAVFEAAGATDVLSHQVNGTVAFTAASPARTVHAVRQALRIETGYHEAVVVRPGPWVVALAGRLREMGLDPRESHEVVLYDALAPPPVVVPWREGRLAILVADDQHAVTAWERTDARGSNAGRVLERLLGVPGTARGTATIMRLAERLRPGRLHPD